VDRQHKNDRGRLKRLKGNVVSGADVHRISP
jgi:hypothetical protein